MNVAAGFRRPCRVPTNRGEPDGALFDGNSLSFSDVKEAAALS
jgi:hypothetical protein